jgi:hypothetical protein
MVIENFLLKFDRSVGGLNSTILSGIFRDLPIICLETNQTTEQRVSISDEAPFDSSQWLPSSDG